jgi:hypothetical protein
MMTGRQHQQTMQQMERDKIWWMARLPQGWKLWGCNGSGPLGYAQVVAPNGNIERMSGALALAYHNGKAA